MESYMVFITALKPKAVQCAHFLVTIKIFARRKHFTSLLATNLALMVKPSGQKKKVGAKTNTLEPALELKQEEMDLQSQYSTRV